ncbi:MAG: hypothetical protein O2960_13690 [Verrucomicrobia bacterium]|nr:hypothetical protein [Verrucomicrobiota bacterium]
MSNATSRCPAGATENSPAFQRWENTINTSPSPKGTEDVLKITVATAMGFFRPFGTRFPLAWIPTVETVGYSRASLRDEGGSDTPPERGGLRRTIRGKCGNRDVEDSFSRFVRGVAATAGPWEPAVLRARQETRA